MKRLSMLGWMGLSWMVTLGGCADCVPGRVRTLALSESQRARFPVEGGTTSGVACREVCAEFEGATFDADFPRDAFEHDAAGDAGVRQADVTECEVTGMQLICRYASSCQSAR